MLGSVGGLLLFARQLNRSTWINFMLVAVTTIVTLFIGVVGSGWAFQPRYVETHAETDDPTLDLQGVVRHRPPNSHYTLVYEDRPEQARSYPQAPPGFGAVPIQLTTDRYGFRNPDALAQYDIVAVGDSFTAGSHVSDEQGWTELLEKDWLSSQGRTLYNLGVSGADPREYLNNFALLGRRFNPDLVLVMVYEGNDFRWKGPPPLPGEAHAKTSWGARISRLAKQSPVTRGLDHFSTTVLEPLGADRPVPGYQAKMGWMPVAIPQDGSNPWPTRYYSFKPKRLIYLLTEKQAFENSPGWQDAAQNFSQLQQLAEKDGFRLIFVYAPSKPHVVMPLVAAQVPADQLRVFLGYKKSNLPPDEQLKETLYAYLDNQEKVFMDFCEGKKLECLSLTPALTKATARGIQTFYTYDQHWTPAGNEVVAEVLARYLQNRWPAHPQKSLALFPKQEGDVVH
jgi:hypothetical protein